eukprot:TRINITY_DN3484_c0_g3_i6.p2 TRINITY_DN3484_c0_g3~~TRINITY_DN3484_c0_g3_i6.p2  ORF type:complete len:325 (-),score=103.66 TRINITY_DN3484_c0_g3_i6:995-1969(-)
MENNLGSPREELFNEFPEPPVPVTPFKPDFRKGEERYWDGLEGFIKFLSGYVKQIQVQEGKSMANFKNTLEELKNKDQQEKKGEKLDQLVRSNYKETIGHIKERRKAFRSLIKDAVDQKQKFLESMILQKAEEDEIARKLAKISGNDDFRASDKEKFAWDFFGSFALFLQVVMILVFIVTTSYNAGEILKNNGGKFRADDYFSYFIHIGVMVTFGFGYLLGFIKRNGFGAVALNFLLVALAAQWGILNDILFTNISTNATSSWIKWDISITTLINAMYAAAAVSVSYGVVSGKISAAELFVFSFCRSFLLSSESLHYPTQIGCC